jgi:hypothetical protein
MRNVRIQVSNIKAFGRRKGTLISYCWVINQELEQEINVIYCLDCRNKLLSTLLL